MKCCDYSAGMLREPVTFERRALATDNAGGFTETWAAIPGAPTRAFARAPSGSERYSSDRVEAIGRVKLTVRYFAGLSERDAVTIRGVRHNIRFINNVEFRDLWLEIDAERGVAS